MKPFLVKASIFLLAQAMIFALFWNPQMPWEQNYLAASIDKHQRLRTTRSPRIILVGGSNLAFGIKSEELENELQLPVVNMGLHADLGIAFMLDEVERELTPGDTVVFSWEHDIFSTGAVESLGRQLVEVRPASVLHLPASHWMDLIDRHGFAVLGNLARRTVLLRFETPPPPSSERAYKRHGFDAQGSYTGHFGKICAQPRLDALPVRQITEPILRRIEQFARRCQEQQVACFYSCPPQPESLLISMVEAIERNLTELSEIPNLVVLDAPRDHAYAPEAFYDTSYHLTEKGAQERTRRLIATLRPHLQNQSIAAMGSAVTRP